MLFKRIALSSLLAVMALGALLARPVRAAALTVTTAVDVVSGIDGVCSLREAIISANTNTVSGIVLGECPAGSDTETDVITLANGETYTLALAGMDEDASATGDLDIVDNSAELDVQFVVAENGTATIDAALLDRVLHLIDATVEITGLALINGDVTLAAGPVGGIVLNQDGAFTMYGGELRNGTAGYGGGLYNLNFSGLGGRAILDGTQVVLNEGVEVVGGIYSTGPEAYLKLNNALVRANSTPGSGGGIGIAGGVTEIYSSTISLNTAAGDGGGLIAQTATITISHSLIEVNEATTGSGGGLHSFDAFTTDALTVIATTFSENTAGSDGGGIYAQGSGTLSLVETNFSLNSAGDHGGAVAVSYLEQQGGTYQSNQATEGGAAYALTWFEGTDVTFLDNTALDGGAVYTQFFTGTRLRLHHNTAEGFGGGAYIHNYRLQLQDSTFSENSAGDSGGAIYQKSNSSPNNENLIRGTLFHLNTSGNDGGALWTDNSLHFINSTLAENMATDLGGGVYIAATGLVTTTNTTLALNQANGMQGSALYNLGKVWMVNTLFGAHPFATCATVSLVDLISLGHNLSEGSDCNLNAAGDQPSTPAGLVGAVQNNGGPTWTWALDATSAAVDTGDSYYCDPGTVVNEVDQRGYPRVGNCDIGAFEYVLQVFLPLLVK